MPAYKRYCWALGTTSFRTTEFNRKIELQLQLLKEFWSLPQYKNENWSANNKIQTEYYNFLKDKGFIEEKDAPRKDKDAREKTSGLVDLGLITSERRLTEAGEALLSIALSADFSTDNLLQVPADGFIYFKQLIKLDNQIEKGKTVRPYLILAYMLQELGELSEEEFTYLLPLTTSAEKTKQMVQNIKDVRDGSKYIDDIILDTLFSMDNYKEARNMLLSAEEISLGLIQEIGMNRKSRLYDTCYYHLYKNLLSYKNTPSVQTVKDLLLVVNGISGKAKSYWKQLLFNTSVSSKIEREGTKTVNDITLFKATTEREFKEEFFRLLHLFKAKSLLDDYLDLNRRYFKTTDTVIFQDEKVKLGIVPNCFFSVVKNDLFDIAFVESNRLSSNCDLADIDEIFDITQDKIITKVEELYGVQAHSIYDVQTFVDKERYDRLNKMIDEKFTDENIIALMTMFENRSDNDIRSMVTNNADIPTIFEYVLAIAWYKISGRQGKVLEYMNLSLDSDLLPITHAAGGHEDITYKYEATPNYPAHTLLIEATLANSTNQRRMEMEPVSRHLGEYLLSHDEEAYCVFATTYLHINVIADFRGRKFMPYYSSDGTNCVNGMKIIPCQTSEIKTIIQNGLNYEQLYRIFGEAFNSSLAPNQWYEQEIFNKL